MDPKESMDFIVDYLPIWQDLVHLGAFISYGKVIKGA
jgi:hypothetical protein